MTEPRDRPEEPKRLPDDEARRLLARATEIESAQSAGLSLAEIREAALEAGIAPNAFEQALAELGDRGPVAESEPAEPAPTLRSRFTAGVLNSLKTIGLVVATLFVLMLLVDLLFP